jgi:hypothetical protein
MSIKAHDKLPKIPSRTSSFSLSGKMVTKSHYHELPPCAFNDHKEVCKGLGTELLCEKVTIQTPLGKRDVALCIHALFEFAPITEPFRPA